MKKLFKKVKTNDYFIYGFIRQSTNYLIDTWSGYSVENMDKIAEYSNENIFSYDNIEYFSYITLISLFFNPTKNNYAIYINDFEKIKDEYSINRNFRLNITYETIEKKIKNFSLYKGKFEKEDNLYIKKILELKNLFSYNIISVNSDSSQGITFIVTDKIALEKDLVELINKTTDIKMILNYVSYMVVCEVGHDGGDINGFNIYSKNDIEEDILKIEKTFLSRKNIFDEKLQNISKEIEFIKALEVFIGNSEKNELVWQ